MNCCLESCEGSKLNSAVDSCLDEEQFHQFRQNRIEVSFRKGETICKQGMKANSIICVKKGLLKMYREDGLTYNTVMLKKSGDIIGLQSLFTNGIYQYSVEALSNTQTCFIDMAVFEKLFLENSDFSREMVKYINHDLNVMFDKIYSFSIKHIHGRLAEFLLYLQEHIYESNPFELTLSKTELSKILGTSKESISRLFREFKSDGIITESKKQLKIKDHGRLKMISENG